MLNEIFFRQTSFQFSRGVPDGQRHLAAQPLKLCRPCVDATLNSFGLETTFDGVDVVVVDFVAETVKRCKSDVKIPRLFLI